MGDIAVLTAIALTEVRSPLQSHVVVQVKSVVSPRQLGVTEEVATRRQGANLVQKVNPIASPVVD